MLKRISVLLLAAVLLTVSGCGGKKQTKSVPIILYHHLDETGEGGSTMKAELFREHIAALSEAGYTSVSFDELIAFADGKGKLPDKSVAITFDDGYESVYDYAYPVLKEYGMKATIFVIGVSVGKDSYKDTGAPMLPHFDWSAASEMVASGLVSIQTHTHDMHQVAVYDGEDCRKGVQRLPNETDEDYIKAFNADISRAMADIEENTGKTVTVIAYPFGLTDELSGSLSRELGIRATLTTQAGGNTVTKGEPDCLYGMNRFSIDDISAPELLALIA